MFAKNFSEHERLQNGSALYLRMTEYGKVNLKGQTMWQRTEKLISVAHPDFREELIQKAQKLGIWRRSNKI
ncbi:4-hydroxybutyrate coenzyme A transferase [Desulfosporosinus metallidurans]|uniref:4-hydroxybutyrate coenzyme A transferase n=1 Tax=Desulfosporosinus metallidurans TaxID=1888891 RepID=A0A1Q8QQW0_9FIRM|nr:4-hydroxybutyrate coenzyme A transferase [Desulfosporosinus metallidurans]